MSVLEDCGYPPITFPKPGLVVEGWRGGRNVAEGYQRGVSLEYGDIGKTLEQHPLFQKARVAAGDRSVLDYKRMQNLFLILSAFMDKLPFQNVVEFGSFRGGSLLFMGTILQELYPQAQIFGFDTFTGMPGTNDKIDLHRSGDFNSTSLIEVKEAIAEAGLRNVTVVQGLVEELFPAQLPPDIRLGLRPHRSRHL